MKRSASKGIFQSDIIVRTAIAAALDDMRSKPWLVDFVLQSLLDDELTRKYYGEEEVALVKDWFINTEIPVKMAFSLDGVVAPLIAITLTESTEDTASLGDIHYEPFEDIDPIDIAIVKPIFTFTPSGFNPETGEVTLPAKLNTSSVFPGMIVREKSTTKSYVIDSIESDSSFIIIGTAKAPLSLANLTKASVESSSTSQILSLESIVYREGFRLDLFVSGNHTHLLYLHTILVFALNRYKQSLFEARGFERSSVSSTSLGKFERNEGEIIFTRSVMLNGYVRQYWPKEIHGKIDGIGAGGIKILGQESHPSLNQIEKDQGWSVIDENEDSLG